MLTERDATCSSYLKIDLLNMMHEFETTKTLTGQKYYKTLCINKTNFA